MLDESAIVPLLPIPRSEFQEPTGRTFSTEAEKIQFLSQLNKNPSRLVLGAPCKINLFSHVFTWWYGRISKWKTTNLVPVNKYQNNVLLSCHASKTESWIHFKNKIITIHIKNHLVNTKIKHSVASFSWQRQKVSNGTDHVKFYISTDVLSNRILT